MSYQEIKMKLANNEVLDVYEMMIVNRTPEVFTEDERVKAYEQGADLYTEGNLELHMVEPTRH